MNGAKSFAHVVDILLKAMEDLTGVTDILVNTTLTVQCCQLLHKPRS